MTLLRQTFAGGLILLWPAVSMAAPANDGRPAPAHEQADGSIHIVGGKTFSSREEFAASPSFVDGGYRCGTRIAPVSYALPSDCSLSETVISEEYEPGDVLVIPVVFHLVEQSNGTGHIPDDAVYSQIEILNEDYGALAGTPGQGGIDSRIRFVLASTDPDGNPTTGIERITNDDWFEDDGSATDLKLSVGWDPVHYLNIYTNDAAGFLGYATPPQYEAGAEDGVVLLYSAVGRNSPFEPYDQGRTATHEVGHYLGLFHTFDSGCGDPARPYETGDLIADTVPESEAQFGCMEGPSACGGGDNPIHNYMDYTDDICMTGFTAEQINRMRCSALGYRADLLVPHAAPTAAFSATATDRKVMFIDQSTVEGQIVTWSWDFGDGKTSAEPSPTHDYTASDRFTVTLAVTDSLGITATASDEVLADAPPTASFTYMATALEVAFSSTATDDGEITAYAWDFGDGATSIEANPTHAYGEPGMYPVNLTVADRFGVKGVFEMDVTVEEAEGGCGCRVAASQDQSRGAGWIFGFAALAVMAARRRRARR